MWLCAHIMGLIPYLWLCAHITGLVHMFGFVLIFLGLWSHPAICFVWSNPTSRTICLKVCSHIPQVQFGICLWVYAHIPRIFAYVRGFVLISRDLCITFAMLVLEYDVLIVGDSFCM